MASNLGCVGLAVEDSAELERLIHAALEGGQQVGGSGGIAVLRWQDPSGASLVISTRDGDEVLDLLPSYAGTPGAMLANVRAANDEVAVADVLDTHGEQVTMLAAEFEQRRLLCMAAGAVGGPACVVALGVDVAVFDDADAFGASGASLIGDGSGDAGEPPPHFVERGWPWPPRLAAESFMSYGVFGPPEQAEAYARLNGTVLAAHRRRVVATGQEFVAARVRTAGFDVDLCLAGPDIPRLPQAGNVLGGTVFLVVSLDVATHAG